MGDNGIKIPTYIKLTKDREPNEDARILDRKQHLD